MATKQSEPLLDLSSRSFNGANLPVTYRGSSAALTKREQGIRDLGREHSTAMDAMERKVEHGMRGIGKLHQRGTEEFLDTARHHSTVVKQAKGTDYEQRVRQYVDEDLNNAAQHLAAATDVGAYAIGKAMSWSVIPPEEEKKRGLVGLLTGG